MDKLVDFCRYGQALGRAEAGWKFASPALRKAAALAAVSAAWDFFRRDAGAGDIGPAHQATATDMPLLLTHDARREAVLLWLADHGTPSIAEAAGRIATMVGATVRFDTQQLDLLARARDALVDAGLAGGPAVIDEPEIDASAARPLASLAMAIERLRGDADFVEGQGSVVHHTLPSGMLNHYVAAEPAGCWALNLALLASVQPPHPLPLPGLVSRALFLADLEANDIEAQLIQNASAACNRGYAALCRMSDQLARGRDALAHLSRNARAGEAWLLVATLGTCTRTQLCRALGLSRAGGDIQAHALADAGLATLDAGGVLMWAECSRPADVAPALIDQGPLADAVLDLDASMAEVDRLLARTAI